MLRRECEVNMRVRLLLNISRDVASGLNMVVVAAQRDRERQGGSVMSSSQCMLGGVSAAYIQEADKEHFGN